MTEGRGERKGLDVGEAGREFREAMFGVRRIETGMLEPFDQPKGSSEKRGEKKRRGTRTR